MKQLKQTPALTQAVKASQNAKQTKESEIRAFLTQGECLAIKHENYVTHYVTRANGELYLLLAEIMELAECIFATKNVTQIVKEMRKELKYTHNIKTQRNSSELSIIVRFVTRTSRKNALIYSQVLAKAISLNVTSAELAEYIEDNGGINKIREKSSVSLTSDQSKKLASIHTYYANKLLEARAKESPYATFEIDKARTSELYDVSCHSQYVYMVCKKDGLGKFTAIDAIAMDQDLEKRILQRYFDYEEKKLESHVGSSNVQAYLVEKFELAINAENARRAKYGQPLLDKFAQIID